MAHWYDTDGKLRTLVLGAKGQLVEPDIRHARKMQLAPGVTTIIKMAASEALVQYREKQVLQASLATERIEGEADDAWFARIMRASKEHAENAAMAGAHLHAEVEHGLMDPSNNNEWVLAVRACLDRNFGPQDWVCEKGCVSLYGYGTRSDLHTWGEHRIVVDIKTKDGPLDELRTYDEHAMQLAATQDAISDISVEARCGILFVRRDKPEARYVEVPRKKIMQGWTMFLHLLRFWQAKNDYCPSWALFQRDKKGDEA